MMVSLIVPVYKSASGIAELINAIEAIATSLGGPFEAVFVVDGSPDDSLLFLRRDLPKAQFDSQLLILSRNFGAFAAIRSGLEAARGDISIVMSADLQEPPALVL